MPPIARPSRGSVVIARGPLRDELIKATRDFDVPLLGGVLVAQRGGAGGVAHAVHQFRRGRAGRRGDRVRGVSEIVKVEVLREVGNRRPGSGPIAIDGSLSQYVRAFAGEEVAVPARRREVGEVGLELGDEERGKRDGANARLGLGSPDDECAVVELDLLLLHANGSVEEIDVAAFETEEFTSAEAQEAGEEDQAPVSRWCGVGERPDLFDRRYGPLGGSLGAGTFDHARVANDQLVDDRGLEDRAEEPVALGDAVRRELRC